jgi:single-strand DNA-binding protein
MLFNLTFEGNLADEPELRFTPSGKSVCRIRVGHNTRRRTTSGEWTNGPTMWVTVTAWEALAERIATSLHKGDTVIVDARDDLAVWTYLNQANNTPAGQLQVTAANVALSLRFAAATTHRTDRATDGLDDPWAGAPTDAELATASA